MQPVLLQKIYEGTHLRQKQAVRGVRMLNGVAGR